MQAHSPVNGHNDPDHGVALLPEVQVRAEQPEPTSTLAHLRVLHFLPDVVGDRELREGGQGGQTVLVVVLVGGGGHQEAIMCKGMITSRGLSLK